MTHCVTLQHPSRDLFFLFFSSILLGGGLILQVNKADTKGWEMNGIWMHDVKDGKDKYKESSRIAVFWNKGHSDSNLENIYCSIF